jgi:3-deoxy-manno-octulosonate cytidylyltransferase (CMP-KDO synthetase)
VKFPFQVIIPSRYQSSRLPGKPLLEIGGMPLIQHVYEAASKSQAEMVIIATDDKRIEEVARAFGAEVVMTSVEHDSGTDRLTEVIKKNNIDNEMIVVNVQGDEFALPPALIDQVANALNNNQDKQMATLCEEIANVEDLHNQNVVKVVTDINNSAIYFSRSAIPWQNEASFSKESGGMAYRHIGIYAYRAGFLKIFSELQPCALEEIERLEQLRALYNGYTIHVEEACAQSGVGIDTDDDLQKARMLCRGSQ